MRRRSSWATMVLVVSAACGDDPADSSQAPEEPWAVGAGGALWHRTDGAWRSVPSPTEENLRGVWGSGPDDVWAVGEHGAAIHFDGSAWTAIPTGVSVTLHDVAGAGPVDVWAVGDAGTIVHWDGSAWSSTASDSDEDLRTIWAASGVAWIGGPTGALLEWDGAAWRLAAISTRPVVIRDLAGTSPSDLWAVGEERRECGDCGTDECHDCYEDIVLHRGAAGWQEQFIRTSGDQTFSAIAVLGPDDVWLAGSACHGGGEIVRWNGDAWFTEFLDTPEIEALWGASPDALWAAGKADSLLQRGQDGWRADAGPRAIQAIWGPDTPKRGCDQTCDRLALPEPPPIERSPCAGVVCEGGLCDTLDSDGACQCAAGFHAEDRQCVADVACTGVTCSGRGTCRSVDGAPHCDCDAGFVDHGGTACAPIPRDAACSDDGWCVEAPLPLVGITGLWASGPDDVWAISRDGGVARRGPAGWERLDLGVGVALIAIDGTGPDDVWLASHEVLFHWDGQSLAEIPVACSFGAHGKRAMTFLSSLAVAGNGEVFVYGDRPSAYYPGEETGTCRYDGTRWHPIEFDVSANPWGECGRESCGGPLATGASELWCGTGAHWDGTLEQIPGGDFAVSDLWASGPDDVWAAGEQLWHWDGLAWSPTGIEGVSVVDGAAPDDVWAGGSAPGSALWHWDGATWQVRDLAQPARTIAAMGAGEVMVATDETLVHYTADERTEESTALPVTPYALWGAAADDLWLGGTGGFARGDGVSWTAVAVPPLTFVDQILGFAPDDVWALASADPEDLPSVSHLARFDGTSWTSTPAVDLDLGSVVDSRYLFHLSGSASDDVWIGGEESGSDGQSTFFAAHWDGASWTRVETPALNAMWGGSGELWVADIDTFARSTTLARWDGATFQEYPLGPGTIVRKLFGFGPDDVWASGSDGLLLHWDGNTWEVVDSGTNDELFGMWGTGPDDLWVTGGRTSAPAGFESTLLHWNGLSWSSESVPTHFPISGIFGVDGELWSLSPYLLRKR